MDKLTNISNLQILLKSSIENQINKFVFETNSADIKQQMKNAIEKYLLELVKISQINNIEVICDETNNSIEDFSSGILNVDLIVKNPSKELMEILNNENGRL